MLKFVPIIALFALTSAHAVIATDTRVEMSKEGRTLFVNAEQPTIVLQGVVETLKAAGWQEEEKQTSGATTGPWCTLEISKTGGAVYSKCYTRPRSPASRCAASTVPSTTRRRPST